MLDSSKHETSQKRRNQVQNAKEEGEDENSAHKDELNMILFINLRGIHLYKARAIGPSSYPLYLRD
jgi:hypothetical protein